MSKVDEMVMKIKYLKFKLLQGETEARTPIYVKNIRNENSGSGTAKLGGNSPNILSSRHSIFAVFLNFV
jgi:hypothetical protein